ALLEAYPHYARWVQNGWAGGGNGRYYRNGLETYWPHETEAKMAPIVAALPKLTPFQRADFLQSWRSGYYHDNTVRPLELNVVREYLASNPKQINSRTGVVPTEKPWEKMTPEEAQQLAPQLDQNPQPTASLIRALAAGGADKNVAKALAALMGPEAWRLPQHHDQRNVRYRALLKALGSSGTDALHQQWSTLAGGLKTEDVKQDAPPAQRLAVFRKLWSDYTSPKPQLPSVYERLVKVLMFTPEAIPELLKAGTPEAQLLARDAMAKGMSGPDPRWTDLEAASKVNVSSYAPGIEYLARRHRGMAELKRRYPEKDKPHPLEPALGQSVANGLKNNTLEAWQTMAWINMQHPENNTEQVKLIQDLFGSPRWPGMPFEVRFAARQWFRQDAMTPGQTAWVNAADPDRVGEALLGLTEASKSETALAALRKVIEGVKRSPVKIEIKGLDQFAAVTELDLTDPETQDLILEVTDNLRASSPSGGLVKRLFSHLKETREPVLLLRSSGYLWPYIAAVETRSLYQPMKQLTASLIEEHPSAASALARGGVDALTGARNSYGFNPRAHVSEMKALRAKAAMKLGLMVIPVPKTHPAYSVYLSQGEWLTGNEASAWDLLDEHWPELLPIHRDLSLDYLQWTLQQVIYSRDEGRQEELVKPLLAWAREENTPLTSGEKADLEITYGDIAVQRGLLKEALELYKKTSANQSYDGLHQKHLATLRQARVQRLAKDFDAALKTISLLELERVPEIWSDIRY
ncbi:MAG: hypothetical protein AAF492_10640, partial [Verrucomicrobiota bacterium]